MVKVSAKNVKKSSKKEEPATVKTLEGAGVCNRLIASNILKAQRVELSLARKIDKLKEEAGAKIALYKRQAAELAKAVYAFAEQHRSELTEDKKLKTIERRFPLVPHTKFAGS